MNRNVTVLAVLVVALVAGGSWWMLQGAEVDKPAGATGAALGQPEVVDWQSKWAATGLKGALMKRPDSVGADVQALAKQTADTAGIEAALKTYAAQAKLKALSSNRARRHPVRNAAELVKELRDGAPKPVHDVEVAWLAYSLALAQLSKPVFVTDKAGLQTPLLLSRTRLAVRVDATVFAPIGGALTKPTPVDESTAAAWWLIQKAYAVRASKRFADAHALVAAAAAMGAVEAAAFARGVIELDQGLIDRGLDRCAKALAARDDPMARLFLADVLNQLERPFKAWQQVDAALKRHPELAEAHASKGIMEASRVATVPEKDKEKTVAAAEQSLRKALQLDDRVAGARAALAQVLLMQDKVEDAEKVLVQAIEKHKDAAAAEVLSALWRGAERAQELIEKLQPLAKDGDPRVAAALVAAHVAREDLPGAMAVAEKMAKRNPDDPTVALLRADMLRQNGRVDEALKALDALRRAGDDEQVALLQAQLLLQNKRAAEALALLEPIAKRKSGDRAVQILLMLGYKEAGKKSELIALIDRLVSAGVLTALEIAGTLVEFGDVDGAIRVLQKALQAKPTVEAAQLLAMILTASGRKEDAIAMRDKMIAVAGEKADEFKTSIDEAIDGAQQELKQMQSEEAAGVPAAVGADGATAPPGEPGGAPKPGTPDSAVP